MAENSKKTVAVGCKLPQGCIMEVGYKVTPGGILKDPAKYKRVKLNGAEQHAILVGMRTPSPSNLRPGITANVEEAVFDEWAKRAGHNLVRNSLVFKADTVADCQAIADEMYKEKMGFEAVDPSAHPGIGKRTEGENDARVG